MRAVVARRIRRACGYGEEHPSGPAFRGYSWQPTQAKGGRVRLDAGRRRAVYRGAKRAYHADPEQMRENMQRKPGYLADAIAGQHLGAGGVGR